LQSLRPVRRVAELGSLGRCTPMTHQRLIRLKRCPPLTDATEEDISIAELMRREALIRLWMPDKRLPTRDQLNTVFGRGGGDDGWILHFWEPFSIAEEYADLEREFSRNTA
jgi:hypothetical protein